MPGGLSRADRNLLVAAGAVALLMIAGTIAFGPAAQQQSTGIPSTYSSAPDGARAAYLLLQSLHYEVSRWERSPAELANVDPHAVLILAEPLNSPLRPERAALLDFVRKGGRILFCGPAPELFFEHAGVSVKPLPKHDFSPDLPSPFTRGAWRIQMRTFVSWKKIGPRQAALYGDDTPVVLLWKIGKGQILWWAAAAPLTNQGLKQQDNLVLFLNAVSPIPGEDPRRVYWDEYFHNGGGSLWSYIERTPVKWGLLQGVLIFAAVLFTFSRRWGPILPPRPDSRQSPLEFVDTLGSLYRHAKATQVPASVAYRHLRLELARKLGLPADTPDDTLAEAASQRLGWNRERVAASLSNASEAQHVRLPPKHVLKLARELTRHSNRLIISRQAKIGEHITLEHFPALASHVRGELAKIIVGQHEAVDQLLIVLACNGHAVIEGVPGLAKTLLVKSLARVCGLNYHRVQCTPDLMPADITGTNVFNLQDSSFHLHRGPVFTDLLLVDEINRTPPRTQSALLEAMEERQVTIDGVRHELSPNFTVLATQNPIEFEGTYPLPEAQLDRFLLKIKIGYPSAEAETEILSRYETGFDPRRLDAIGLLPLPPGLLEAARAEIEHVKVEPSLYPYIVAIIRRTRDWPAISMGASPRAAVGLLFVARTMAAMDGRDYLLPDDVKAAAPAVLRHRVVLKPEAELEGLSTDDVIQQVLASVEVPRIMQTARE